MSRNYGGGIVTKMPLNHISCHWIINAMSLDQTSFYPTIFFMSLDRMSFYRTIFFMSLDRTSCHWIELHATGSDFMLLDLTSCYWIWLHVIGSDFMLLDHIILLDRFHFIGALLSGQRFIIRNNISQNAFRHKVPRVQTGLKWFQLIPWFTQERESWVVLAYIYI